MVQSLPGFLNLCLNVSGPSQVLRDVYTEVLETADPLHKGPTQMEKMMEFGTFILCFTVFVAFKYVAFVKVIAFKKVYC